MIFRQVPPVFSPVSAGALRAGAKAALGLGTRREAALIDALCAAYHVNGAILTDSGTSALVLALRAVCKPGGTVAYPAYACIDLTTAALAAGLRVRLYDLDPETLSPDLDSVRAVIGRGVDAIVVAHLFGYAADILAVERVAAESGIPVIEDAAQNAGATLHGRRLGGIAKLSTLSFGRGKGTTAGSGGAVLVRGSDLENWASDAREQLGAPRTGGREVLSLAAQRILSQPFLYRLPSSIPALKLGEMVYHPPTEPAAMSDTAAAMLPGALALDAAEVSVRRERAALLSAARHGSRFSLVRGVPGSVPGYLRLAMVDTAGNARLPRSLGVMRGYPLTLEDHVQLRNNLAPMERAGSGAAWLRDKLFTLPTHSRASTRDLGQLLAWLQQPQMTLSHHLSPVRA